MSTPMKLSPSSSRYRAHRASGTARSFEKRKPSTQRSSFCTRSFTRARSASESPSAPARALPTANGIDGWRYTGRVTESKLKLVSVNPSSAAIGGRLGPGSETRELVAQWAEAHAAEVERVAVELLQVEVRAVPSLGIGPGFQPHAFADLVADGLAGPAEVAVDLAPHEVDRLAAALDHERQRELRRPRLTDVLRLARRDR